MANQSEISPVTSVTSDHRSVPWLGRSSTQQLLKQAILYVVLSLLALLFAIPLLWMISTSLKSLQQQSVWPPVWIPQPLAWQNYPDAFNFLPLGRYTLNTQIITAFWILGTYLTCPLVAYAFARIRFPGRDALFVVLIATIMLPGAVRLIPTYLMYDWLGWLNTYLPLVVPAFFGTPFYIFLLRQYFRTFPGELSDAHYICKPPGDVSIHHPKILHGSNANTSAHWRRGLTIRCMPTSTRVTKPNTSSQFLLRGAAVPGINQYLPRPRFRPGEHMSCQGQEAWL